MTKPILTRAGICRALLFGVMLATVIGTVSTTTVKARENCNSGNICYNNPDACNDYCTSCNTYCNSL
ncbi:MAG: hypothetical protein K2Y23_14895 [Cyanobacteria bacterium]|nr:hypothetical protein [Cyanobacteriota bacterium]